MEISLAIWLFLALCGFQEVLTQQTKKLPNIVLILTDDQDVVLDGLKPMKKVNNLIAQQGATFENAVSTFIKKKILNLSISFQNSLQPHRYAVLPELVYYLDSMYTIIVPLIIPKREAVMVVIGWNI